MLNKRIVFTAPNVTEVLESPAPELAPGQVLVQMAVSTISSGTERANLSGDANVTVKKAPGAVSFPRYGGYSSAGIIVAVAEDVTDYAVGDRVAMFWSTHSLLQAISTQQILKLPVGTAVMLDVKNIRGEFYYNSSLGKTSTKISTAAVEEMIATLKSDAFREKILALGGYTVENPGEIIPLD